MTPRPPISPARLAPMLGGLAMFGAFSIDTLFPAFPDISAEYGVGKVAMQQTVSLYLLAYALMSLVHGPLSDAVGRRRVIVGGLLVFIVASIGCALAPSMTWLLAFRVLQGLSAGVGMIVGRAVVRDCLDGDDAQRLMSHVSMIFGIAPAIAPVIGGWIVGWADWRAVFWFITGFGVLMLVAVLAGLPETHHSERRTPMRVGHLWHGNIAMLRNREFLRLALVSMFNFGALFLYIASAPAFVLDVLRLGPQQFAWFFVPTISGMMLGAFTSGRLAGRVSSRRLANIGFAVCALAVALNLGYNLSATMPTVPWAVLPLMVNAFGVALVFPIVTLLILDMYPRQRGAASSLQAFLSLGFNALIAGVLSAAVSHDSRLLAITAASFSILAWWLWRRYVRHCRYPPDAAPLATRMESGEGI